MLRVRTAVRVGGQMCAAAVAGRLATSHRGQGRSTQMWTRRLHVQISPEVAAAVLAHRPVVALESTIISHGGLPYPKNLELAKKAEAVVRKHGAIPATCAVIGGVPKVGLDLADLELLAKEQVTKASRRDLPFVCREQNAQHHASTTVAGTMVLAHLAGIRVFATGGIGGVHRGAEDSFDVSADLLELGRTPVSVVCAGVKSILDVAKTLEVLETQGVPVVTLESDIFPAFFTNNSGLKSPLRVDSPRALAEMAFASMSLNLQTGMVVAVQNPEPHADPAALEECIVGALKSADEAGVTGPAITPYLLAKVEALTGGRSLEANVALLLNNARVAALMAVELSRLSSGQSVSPDAVSAVPVVSASSAVPAVPGLLTSSTKTVLPAVVVVGGAARDVVASMSPMVPFKSGSSNPGKVRGSFGGVGRNISEQLSRLGHAVTLCSAVGNDDDGRALLSHAARAGVDITRVRVVPEGTTASYVAVHGPGGDLVAGVANMDVLKNIGEAEVAALAGSVRLSQLVVADGNISPAAFAALCRLCVSFGVPLFFEPTSDHKCLLPLLANSLSLIDVIKPNASELRTLCTALLEQHDGGSARRPMHSRAAVSNALAGRETEMDLVDVRILAQALVHAMRGDAQTAAREHTAEGLRRAVRHKHVLVSLGARGVLWAAEAEALRGPLHDKHGRASLGADGLVATLHVPCAPLPEGAASVDTNGSGDAFCAAVIQAMLAPSGPGLDAAAILQGHEAARECILASST